jgi:HK97 family phage major capsid protein
MANRIKELREKQAVIVAEARERLDQIGGETDETRAKELETQHDKAMAEHDRLEKLIEREEQLIAAEKRQEELRARQRPVPPGGEARGDDDGDKLEYREVFHKFLSRGGDPGELSAEERGVLRAGSVPNAEFRAQSTTGGGGSAGGYTVPVELADEIIKSMKAWGPMYDEDICTVFNTASGVPMKIPTVDDTAVTATARSEGAALTDTGDKDVTFGQKSLDAYVFDTHFVRFSFELAQDSMFNVETLLGSLLGERLGRIANSQLSVGTGTSAPNGVVNASSLGRTSVAASAITGDEIIDLVHSVDPAYRQSPKVRFMFNDLTLAAIRKLKDGQGNYLWQMGDVSKSQPGTLLGYRYSINQAMDSLAAAKKIMLFGDFGKYFVRKVGAPAIGVLRERFWPDLGIAGLVRFDGELGDTAAVKHLITAAS